jgi:hypothetical protein
MNALSSVKSTIRLEEESLELEEKAVYNRNKSKKLNQRRKANKKWLLVEGRRLYKMKKRKTKMMLKRTINRRKKKKKMMISAARKRAVEARGIKVPLVIAIM